MRDQALEFLEGGLSVIPIRADGSKAPAVSFETYKSERRPTAEEIDQWFRPGVLRGIGIICGILSGNLVVFDFETNTIFGSWGEVCEAEGIDLTDFSVVSSPKGKHLYVRADTGGVSAGEVQELLGGRKLAWRQVDGKREVLIETRGQGHYVVGPGSPKECKTDSERGWEHVSGPPIHETGKAPVKLYRRLLALAGAFNEAIEPVQVVSGLSGAQSVSEDDKRPGTDYCRRSTVADYVELVCRYGWVVVREAPGGSVIVRRPGKVDKGGSATIGAVSTSLGPCLYVFSTNADPFESEKCYSIFSAKAILEHKGDYSECSKSLLTEGYGGEEVPPEIHEKVREAIDKCKDDKWLEKCEKYAELHVASAELFAKTWKFSRKAKLGTVPTKYDTSLVRQLFNAGPDEDWIAKSVGVVYLWRMKHGFPAQKAYDIDYMGKLFAWILKNKYGEKGRSDEEVCAQRELDAIGDDFDDQIKALSERLDFEVNGFWQTGTRQSNAEFTLTYGENEVHFESVKAWAEPKMFEMALTCWRDQEGKGFSNFKGILNDELFRKASWRVVQLLLYRVCRIREDMDSVSNSLRRWSYEYWVDDRTQDEKDDWKLAAFIYKPFIHNSLLHISVDHFLNWLIQSRSYRPNRSRFLEELRTAGFRATEKWFMGPHDEKRKRRRLWCIALGEVSD